MVTPAWGVSAERYEELYVKAARQLGQSELASPIVPLIGRDTHVLDLGCGTGWQARFLVDRGCTVVGVEVDVKAAARATAWCERVIVCDLDVVDLATELGGERFDAVAAGDVLEHLRDPEGVLRSLALALRPGGRVVASVPNVAHGSVRLALLTGTFSYQDAGLLDRTHLRFFTRSSVEQLFVSAGFKIDRIERVEVPIEAGVPYDRTLLPPGVEQAVASMPEARTFQFVVMAVLAEQPEPRRRAAGGTPDERASQGSLLAAQADALRLKEEAVLELRRDVAGLEEQLAEIHRSRMWRLWRRSRSFLGR